jgi:PhnB protein
MKMEVNAYLSFNGQCEEAFKFYAKCFETESASFFKYAGSPMEDQAPPEWGNKVMHATLVVGNGAILGADAPPQQFTPPAGFTLSIGMNNPEDAERVFNALSKGGKVQMPLQQTFWALRFGMLVDQFGIPWMVNCEQPQATTRP